MICKLKHHLSYSLRDFTWITWLLSRSGSKGPCLRERLHIFKKGEKTVERIGFYFMKAFIIISACVVDLNASISQKKKVIDSCDHIPAGMFSSNGEEKIPLMVEQK